MPSTSHHVEEDGAGKFPEGRAKTVSLTNSHQWDGEVAACDGGASTASRDVVN